MSIAQHHFHIAKSAYEMSGKDFSELCNRSSAGRKILKQSADDARLSFDDFTNVIESVKAELADPLFGLYAGQYTQPSDYGLHGQLWVNSDTLLDCLMSVINYSGDMIHGFNADYYIRGETFTYEFSIPKTSPEAEAYYIDLDLTSMLSLGKYLVGELYRDKMNYQSIGLRRSLSKEEMLQFTELFNCPIKDQQATNSICFDMQSLRLPIRSPNKQLQKIIQAQINEEMGTGLPSNSVQNRVLNCINHNIRKGVPKLEDTAALLNISTSTLKRNLKKEGTSYVKLLDEVRIKYAKALLKNDDTSIKEISLFLGYSNTSSLTRAFCKWTGITPKQYREKELQLS